MLSNQQTKQNYKEDNDTIKEIFQKKKNKKRNYTNMKNQNMPDANREGRKNIWKTIITKKVLSDDLLNYVKEFGNF